MAALDTVPVGSDILIDTNVFIYGLSNQSTQCKDFLERCSREQVFGITLYTVVNEATHRFMIAELRAKDLADKNPVKYLSENPQKVKGLTDYWHNVEKLLALNLVLLEIEERIVTQAQVVRTEAGLLTNDSIIVATMREYEISNIATNDRMFNAVTGVSVFSPTDI